MRSWRVLLVLLALSALPLASAEERIVASEWSFDPATAFAASWESVLWRWPGDQTHGVAADDGNATWCEPSTAGCRRVFTEPGEYRYHCPVHPEMRGVIHVDRQGGDAGAPLRAVFRAEINALTVDLDASASGQSRTAIESFSWDLGDATIGEGRRLRHAYGAPGNYTVVLTVVDEFGKEARNALLLRLFSAEDAAVIFRANVTDRVVAFDAPAIEGAHSWDFGDGASVLCAGGCTGDMIGTLASSDTALLHVYTRAGSFVVNHTAAFANGTARSAEARVSIWTADTFLVESDGLAVRADASALPRYGNATFLWLFGDLEHAEGERVEHAFPSDGRWSIEMTMSDAAGDMRLSVDVELSAPPEEVARANAPPPTAAVPALPVVFALVLAAALARVSESYK